MALSSVIGVDAATVQVNIAGPLTLTGSYALDLDTINQNVIAIDCGGASREVILYPAASTVGMLLRIVNFSDAAETITVKNTAAATVGTIEQNREAEFMNVAGTWYFVKKNIITLS
jgi:hypothetical protein